MSLFQSPVPVTVQASLSRRNGILNNMKKGKLGSLDFMVLPVNRFKMIDQIMSHITNPTNTSVKIRMTLVCHLISRIHKDIVRGLRNPEFKYIWMTGILMNQL